MRARTLRLSAALAVTACLAAPAVVAAHGVAAPPVPADPAVVTEWNEIAARTIYTENSTPVPASALYFGFVGIAVHDAVAAIDGRYRTYGPLSRPPAVASPEVAAATAAYRVLRHYFPASAGSLDADYAAFLAGLTADVGRVQGQPVGEQAAAALIQRRVGDGRGAPVTLDAAPAPGGWRPTPDAFAPMAVPWLGFVTPLGLRSPTQIPVPGPDPLGSSAYARDVAEVQAYGAKDSPARTAEQTLTALFWNANPVAQYQAALRDQVSRRGLDIAATARAFALLGTSTADVLIACWHGKFEHATWRPVTAIRLADTDGNAATRADAEWTPLLPTPPYPEYASGHACVTGAASGTFGSLFGADALDLDISSSATSTTRHYATAAALDAETMDARIWLGFHFRKAMTDGNRLGHQVADWTAGHHFGPAR